MWVKKTEEELGESKTIGNFFLEFLLPLLWWTPQTLPEINLKVCDRCHKEKMPNKNTKCSCRGTFLDMSHFKWVEDSQK